MKQNTPKDDLNLTAQHVIDTCEQPVKTIEAVVKKLHEEIDTYNRVKGLTLSDFHRGRAQALKEILHYIIEVCP